MKITRTKLKQIIKEELEAIREISPGDNVPMTPRERANLDAAWARAKGPKPGEPGRFDKMFVRGEPGNVFAEAVASELWLDDDDDFNDVVKVIKDGLNDWYRSRWAGKR